MEENDFEVIDVENITDHYTLTAKHWYENLAAHFENLGAAAGIDPERFRAQLLFLAGCVVRFSENRILDYQVVARKIEIDAPRFPLPATRRAMIL